MVSTIIKKSAIVGLVVFILDYIMHSNYANPETNAYFVAKFVIAAYVAYYLYEGKLNFLKLKPRSTLIYLYFGALFASIHGLYYRAIEILQGQPFLSRVGDIQLGPLMFSSGSLFEMMVGWTLIHGGAFFIGVLLANKLIRK